MTVVGVLVVLLLAGGYAALLARAAGHSAIPWWRVVAYLLLAVLPAVAVLIWPIAGMRTEAVSMALVRLAVLSSVVPAGIALGAPVTLWRQGSRRPVEGGSQQSSSRAGSLVSRALRVLCFPAVSSVLAVGTLAVGVLTRWLEASIHSQVADGLLVVAVLGTGCLFLVPLVAEDLLPSVAPGMRLLISLVDGLLDALPGILVLLAPVPLVAGLPTGSADASYDQHLGGGLMVAVAEVVGLPVMAVLFVAWMRHDAAAARAHDLAEDALLRARESIDADAGADIADAAAQPAGRAEVGSAPSPGGAAPDEGTPDPGRDRQRPWWESDPRFAGRYRRADHGAAGPAGRSADE